MKVKYYVEAYLHFRWIWRILQYFALYLFNIWYSFYELL